MRYIETKKFITTLKQTNYLDPENFDCIIFNGTIADYAIYQNQRYNFSPIQVKLIASTNLSFWTSHGNENQHHSSCAPEMLRDVSGVWAACKNHWNN